MATRIAEEENKKAGDAFLAENKTKEGVTTLPSGLQYKILKAGDGRKPTDADTVVCQYRGTLIDGTEFDGTEPGKPATLTGQRGHPRLERGPEAHACGLQVADLHPPPACLRGAGIGPHRAERDDHLRGGAPGHPMKKTGEPTKAKATSCPWAHIPCSTHRS